MQPVYINGAARIGASLETTSATNSVAIEEPDYTQYIEKRKLRRMDRLSRFALHTTYSALEQAGVQAIDGVIMGVGQTISKTIDGMLRKMIGQKEGLTTPTNFMNSLLSTAAGQIALQLSCSGYSNTHTQRGFSTESALLDAALQLSIRPTQNIVVGGLDVTHESYAELSDKYGHLAANTTTKIERAVGEGAATFLVSGEASVQSIACIKEIYTVFLTEDAAQKWSKQELQKTLFGETPPNIDLVISGRPRGNEAQRNYNNILAAFSSKVPIINYKKNIGEFPTASAHGLYMAVGKLSEVREDTIGFKPKRILVLNNYSERYMSAFLVTRP